jgi:sugar transferase (PEP-CTERM/EpsH1 system associated)
MPKHDPPLVVHIIYALGTGGMENGLVNILNRTPAGRYRHAIICITCVDNFVRRISAKDIEIFELNKREGHDLRFYWKLWRLLRKLRPDIIHSRNLAALETQLLGIGLGGVKRVQGEHGREANDLEGTNAKYLLLRKFVGPLIHRYIAVSKDLEQWLVGVTRIDAAKVRQIYNGVNHQLFSPGERLNSDLLPASWGPRESFLVIGTVGRLTPVKDQRSILLAMASMRASAPSLFGRVRLVLVGDGPLREELGALAHKLDLEQKVWLTGDRDDIPDLLRLMDIFVLPSLVEGISNTALEAMASGLPVVATAVGGNTELIEDNTTGRLVPLSDPDSLARVLVELLENPAERAKLGSSARQFVCNNFDWNRTVRQYLGVYDELLNIPTQHSMTTTV